MVMYAVVIVVSHTNRAMLHLRYLFTYGIEYITLLLLSNVDFMFYFL